MSTSRARLLYIAPQGVDDVTFGAAQRTNAVWTALEESAAVDVLVVEDGANRLTREDVSPGYVRIRHRRRGTPGGFSDVLAVRNVVRAMLRGSSYEAVVVRYASLTLYVPSDAWARTVFDADDLVKRVTGPEHAARGGQRTLPERLRHAYLSLLLPRLAHVWFVSERDLEVYGHLVRSASVLPNPAPVHRRPKPAPVSDVVLAVGNYGHPPNREGIDAFVREVLPRLREEFPTVSVRLVGTASPEWANRWRRQRNVKVLGFVDDLGLEYAAAALAVVPVTSGGGSQIKLIEALANGCPVVTSSFAYGPYACSLPTGAGVLVATTPDEWVESCLRVLRDPLAARKGIAPVQRLVTGRFSRETIAQEVASTLHKVTGL